MATLLEERPSSDTVLVASRDYDAATGRAYRTVDPAGKEDWTFHNDAGRVVRTVANYVDGNPATGQADQDVTIETTYTADGQIATYTAKNPTTGDQTTRYVYGTALAESGVARADLLRAVIYPDPCARTRTILDGAVRLEGFVGSEPF